LRGLAGEVFSVTEGGYEYKVDIFESVTQRKTTENVPMLLGVWDRWEVVEREKEGGGEKMMEEEEKTFSFRMVYTDGATCMANTSVVRSVVVDFLCAAPAAAAAATAATATAGDGVKRKESAASTGMSFVEQIVKAREEDREQREGASTAAVVAQEEEEKDQQQQQTTTYEETNTIPSLSTPSPQKEGAVDFRLADAKEPSTCRYHLTLHSPVPCAVFKKELASFKRQKEEEKEGGGGGGTKMKKKKKGKGKKGGRKGGLAPLMGGVGRWMGGLWGKAVKAATNSIAGANTISSSSSSSFSSSSSSFSVCTCPAAADTAAAAAASVAVGGEGEEEKDGGKQIEALVKEVGELRSQLSAFLEEMRGRREGGKEGGAVVGTAPVGEGAVA